MLPQTCPLHDSLPTIHPLIRCCMRCRSTLCAYVVHTDARRVLSHGCLQGRVGPFAVTAKDEEDSQGMRGVSVGVWGCPSYTPAWHGGNACKRLLGGRVMGGFCVQRRVCESDDQDMCRQMSVDMILYHLSRGRMSEISTARVGLERQPSMQCGAGQAGRTCKG